MFPINVDDLIRVNATSGPYPLQALRDTWSTAIDDIILGFTIFPHTSISA